MDACDDCPWYLDIICCGCPRDAAGGMTMPDESRNDAIECCKTCRFWLPGRDDTVHALGSCKRYAPSVVVGDFQAVPATLAGDFCGEWKRFKAQ